MPLQNRRQVTENRKEDTISPKVFVGNLSDDTTQVQLQDIFFEIGMVLDIFVPTDQDSGRPKGFAVVEFADEASVKIALEKFNGYELNGKKLQLSQAEDRPQPSTNIKNQATKPGRTFKKSKGKGSRRNLRAKKRSG